MDTAHLIKSLNQKEILVTLTEDNNLRVDYDGEISEDILMELKENKGKILTYLRDINTLSITPLTIEQKSYDISDHQKRIWILSNLYEGGTAAYNIFGSSSIHDEYSLDNFTHAINDVIDRHETLRTIFKEDKNGLPRQIIKKRKELDYNIEYYDFKKSKDQKNKVQAIISNNQYLNFDLENGPLFRISLFEMSDNHLIIYFNIHHIICDAWSLGVLFNDIMEYYNSYKNNELPQKKELAIQYKDFTHYQLNMLKSRESLSMKEYWMNKLKGDIPHFELPLSKTRPLIKTFNGYRMEFNFSEELTLKLKDFCTNNGGTFFTGILTTLKILFYKYTGNKDIIVGSPITNRTLKELENQVGFYGNTLAMRTEFSDNDSFLSMYSKVKKTVVEAYNNAEYPFIRLIDDLKIQKDQSRNPLVNILVALQNELRGTHNSSSVKDKIINKVIEFGEVRSRLDIDFSFEEVGDNLNMLVEFNPDLFDKNFINRLILNYKELIINLLNDINKPINLINCLTIDEKKEQLLLSKGSNTFFNEDKSVVDVFNETCEKFPDKIAVKGDDYNISYNDLHILSNQFAHFLLKKMKLAKTDFVIIQIKDSLWSVVSQIAIMKLKKAFIPVDYNSPVKRIEKIKRISNTNLIITQNIINEFNKDINNIACNDLDIEVKPNDLAYIIYTSGTTGSPKAVKIKHESINRLAINNGFCNIDTSTTILSTASFSFDASIFEIYGTLLNGGTLVLLEKNCLLDPIKLDNSIKKYEINTMWLTSSWLNKLIDMKIELFSNLTTLICGGEALSSNKIKLLLEKYPKLDLINGYGPTENCTFSLTNNLNNNKFDTNVPIGKVINNSLVYILNEDKMLIPKGAIGEIYVGGTGLSTGYLNNEELTKKVFVKDPFEDGKLIYKTGDLGRIREDNMIEFIGRKDTQIKINGYRVEIEEIEEALCKNENVNQAAVVLNEENKTNLIAYIKSKNVDNINIKKIYLSLEKLIPSYMIPTKIITLDEFPLSTNGKINYNKLRDLERESSLEIDNNAQNNIKPKNEKERWLLEIWKEIFKTDNILVNSNFFDLGGNSITLIELSSKMSLKFDVTYSTLGNYIEKLTIEEIANKIPLKQSNMRRKLKLIKLTKNREKEYYDMLNDFHSHNESIDGFKIGYELTDFDLLLNRLEENYLGVNLADNFAPNSTFYFMNKNDDIVGFLNLRHSLSAYLELDGGHIGFAVRPSFRKKGYATEILKQGLIKAQELNLKSVLLSVNETNIGSIKVIEKNKGKLILTQTISDVISRNYQIDLI